MANPYEAQSKVNPQTVDGWRGIPNDVWLALIKARLSGGEYQCIMMVIDLTWGYQRQESPISLSSYESACGLTRAGIIKSLKSLSTKKILYSSHNSTHTTVYGFNKHYDTWNLPEPSKLELPSASKPGLPSEPPAVVNQSIPALVNPSIPPSQLELTSTSKLPTPTTEPVNKGKKVYKERYKEIGAVPLPEWLDKETWESYLEMRRRKKASPTPKAVELAIATLSKLRAEGQDPTEIINQSILNNWTGLFPLKGGTYGSRGKGITPHSGVSPPQRTTNEQRRRSIRDIPQVQDLP